tara:strand:- start:434 stop:766 length:333 start_codon:yes stop_codon:yes gene_type:complete
MKQNEQKINKTEDNKELIELDYSYLVLILSLVVVLIIIFFKVLLNDIFIRFIYKYTIFGVYLRKMKDYFSYEKVELTKEILKGGGQPNSFEFFNNELPLSDWSGLSSINF